MTTKKDKKPIPYMKIYFTGKDEALLKKVKKLASAHGMSVSKIGALAIRLGLPLLRRNLEGLLIDIESQEQEYETKKGLTLKW